MEVIITPEMTLNEVIKKYPATMGTFNRFNIDSCCGGARTVADAAREDGADLGVFIKALQEAAGKG